jgi:hypothetical protein
MQLAIELPDELCKEVLNQRDVQHFVRMALEKELMSEKKINQIEQELFELIGKIPSSVNLVDELIQERKLEFIKEFRTLNS